MRRQDLRIDMGLSEIMRRRVYDVRAQRLPVAVGSDTAFFKL
jgi:hypothetical protein